MRKRLGWGKWLKIIVLILLPINAWLAVLFYLQHQKKQIHWEWRIKERRDQIAVSRYMQEMYGIKIGQSFQLPSPHTFIGSKPPFGQGYPVCFLNVGPIIEEEIWGPIVSEALKTSPYLYIVLVHYPPPFERQWDWRPIRQFIQNLGNSRLSALIVNWQFGINMWGQAWTGSPLLVLCDGGGIVRAIEPYPNLKISPHWQEEVADWRPKLHQAVKKVLDKFFPKGQGR